MKVYYFSFINTRYIKRKLQRVILYVMLFSRTDKLIYLRNKQLGNKTNERRYKLLPWNRHPICNTLRRIYEYIM